MQVGRAMQVVAFTVVSGYCDAWLEVGERKAEQSPVWAGVVAEIEAMELDTAPSERHLAWLVAAGLALHTTEFDGTADEFGAALQVALGAVRMAELEQGVSYV